jgi:hypothetical protein
MFRRAAGPASSLQPVPNSRAPAMRSRVPEAQRVVRRAGVNGQLYPRALPSLQLRLAVSDKPLPGLAGDRRQREVQLRVAVPARVPVLRTSN